MPEQKPGAKPEVHPSNIAANAKSKRERLSQHRYRCRALAAARQHRSERHDSLKGLGIRDQHGAQGRFGPRPVLAVGRGERLTSEINRRGRR